MKAQNQKHWHKTVCERDKFICQKCKKSFAYWTYFDELGTNQWVCGHHKKTKGAHPEEKLETDNGECVCLECHNKLHNG